MWPTLPPHASTQVLAKHQYSLLNLKFWLHIYCKICNIFVQLVYIVLIIIKVTTFYGHIESEIDCGFVNFIRPNLFNHFFYKIKWVDTRQAKCFLKKLKSLWKEHRCISCFSPLFFSDSCLSQFCTCLSLFVIWHFHPSFHFSTI